MEKTAIVHRKSNILKSNKNKLRCIGKLFQLSLKINTSHELLIVAYLLIDTYMEKHNHVKIRIDNLNIFLIKYRIHLKSM